MTIFDLPSLDPNDARSLIGATIAKYPQLRRFYDSGFIEDLIRRRAAYDNILLLRLIRPNDEVSAEYWTGVVGDLLSLETEGSFAAFRDKFRKRDGPSLESARTELFFAAWLKRCGLQIKLEPSVGKRRCEFIAGTAPETWWEIKTPLDVEELRLDAAVQADVQRRLRFIEQPYVLSLLSYNLTLQQIPAAVRSIKREIRKHYLAAGKLPRIFDSDGLVISADALTHKSQGFLGVVLSKPTVFNNENTARVVRRIIDAADQLPVHGGGVIVIDRSSSDWIEHHDVEDACFGEERTQVANGWIMECRLPGVFDANSKARISAVVSYTRRWREDDRLMTILHNPNALKPLPLEALAFVGIRQTCRQIDGDGFRLVTT